jgi:uncharacterized protein
MMKAHPYRTLSSFLRERFGQRVQKISLDTGLGCPNRDAEARGGCIYCNARGSGTGALSAGMGLKDQIESQMSAMSRRYHAKAFIAYFQSFTNTYADVPVLKGIFDTVLPYSEIVGLDIGTRPDCVDENRLSLIQSYADTRLVWVEYGLQTASDATLARINRGHDVQAFVDAVQLTAGRGLRICAHAIIGLPGEGMDHFMTTARLISSLPVTDVKIHLLYVARGTALETLFLEGGYRPLNLEEYAHAAASFIATLREDIVIQRITGDPHPEELVAPEWALNKAAVRDAVHAELERSGLSQGSLHTGS